MYLQVLGLIIVHGGACDGNLFDEFVCGANTLNGVEKRCRTIGRLVMNQIRLRYPNAVLQEVVIALDAENKRVLFVPIGQRDINL